MARLANEIVDYQRAALLRIDDTREIWFSTYTLGKRRTGCARIFQNTAKYSGPTRFGIDMPLEQLEALKDSLSGVSSSLESGEAVPPLELCRLPGGRDFEWVAQVLVDEKLPELYVLDVRKYVSAKSYTGWKRGGLRLPVDYIDAVVEGLDAVCASLRSYRDGDWGLFEQVEEEPETGTSEAGASIEAVPQDYEDYF